MSESEQKSVSQGWSEGSLKEDFPVGSKVRYIGSRMRHLWDATGKVEGHDTLRGWIRVAFPQHSHFVQLTQGTAERAEEDAKQGDTKDS